MKNILISREEAVRLREEYRAAGKTVGYTSGVFDIVHAGHVEYLAEAASKVDILLVGINADSSVRANKGPTRPINPESLRAEVIGGLRSVGHVFIFSELNNNVNVEALKPDLYLKAGDYSTDKLTSKNIVESYGGRVEIIPFRDGLSTSQVISKIAADAITQEGPAVSHKRAPAVFVDRDGTINEHIEYLSDPKKFAAFPGAFVALKKLREAGYRVVIVTNQPGIGLGYFTKEEFFAVNREMMKQASAAGTSLDKIYFCSHSKSEACACRKPEPFFLHRAEKELNVDLSKSFVIGDMTSDIQLGKNGGCRTVLVKTGRGGDDGMFPVEADYTAKDMLDAAAWIMAQGTVLQGAVTPGLQTEPSEPAKNSSDDESVERIATKVSADFNNIFGSILGCAALIAQKSGVEKGAGNVDDALTILKKAANRGLAISKKMNNLFWTGDATRGQRSLKSCIESVVELLSSSHGGECQIEVFCPQDIEVEMADFAVVQMLLELCENSLEAMAALPERFILFHVDRVEVSDQAKSLELKPGSYAKVSLVDHGDGIDPSQREVVFQPFASSKMKEGGEGIGLSLSMAKSVMKKHGGTITLASQHHAGTNISLYFPAVKQG